MRMAIKRCGHGLSGPLSTITRVLHLWPYRQAHLGRFLAFFCSPRRSMQFSALFRAILVSGWSVQFSFKGARSHPTSSYPVAALDFSFAGFRYVGSGHTSRKLPPNCLGPYLSLGFCLETPLARLNAHRQK
ncbi:RING-type domain-containing protein [Psidium guajava]|nr:RING-type domain-containing protein [Psidium guajava]